MEQLAGLKMQKKKRKMGRENGVKRYGVSGGGDGGLADLFKALASYSERHYRRFVDLWDESYLMEFTLGEMDSLLVEDAATDGVGRDAFGA